MKNILILMGSPRLHGNTVEAIEGAKQFAREIYKKTKEEVRWK